MKEVEKRTLYTVVGVLLAVVSILFCGCNDTTPHLNIENARDNLKQRDYYVSFDMKDTFFEGYEYCIDSYLEAESNLSDDAIILVKFNKVKDASLFYECILLPRINSLYSISETEFLTHLLKKYNTSMTSTEYNKLYDTMRENKNEIEDIGYGQSGKYVWYGTKRAIKDSK
ncbi:MAG: hypothetical protein IJF71_07955 [Clostridia bacterium]|nr:hypothetical protein [Clostridia bacterium]